jgi:2-keto-4-pentenoate hydratase
LRTASEESAEFFFARQRLSLLVDPPEKMAPRDENEAYALQDRANRRLSDLGLGSRIGFKIGCTTPVMQRYLGIFSPCAGEIFEATRTPNGGQLERSRYRKLGVECEIVAQLSRDIAAKDAPFTRESVAASVGALAAGIEVVDDRYRDFKTLGAPTLIVDNFFNAGFIIGELVRDWEELDLAALRGRILINGCEVASGDGAMVLGHPMEALVWLANSRAGRGLGLQKGQFVFLGSLVETKWLNVGDVVQSDVTGLGSLDVRIS